jgi:Ni,Fe-hydrogenase I cytochrome b subunit
MEKHITLVAAFHITFGIISIIAGIVLATILASIGFLSREPQAMAILGTIAPLIGLFMIIVGLPMVIGGIGLLKRRSWSRILVIIVSVLALFKIPIGTALGVYSIWAMLQDETVQILNQ